MQQANVVVQPAEIFAPLRFSAAVRRQSRSTGLSGAAESAIALVEKAGTRASPAATPACGPARPRPGRSASGLGRGFFRRLRQMLRVCVQRLDMGTLEAFAANHYGCCLAITRSLHFKHFGVPPAEARQLLVAAFFGNFAVGQHHDAVGHAHGRKPMRDKQRHLARRQFGEALETLRTRCARRAPRWARRGSAAAHRAGKRAPAPAFCHSPPERSTPVSKRRPSICS